MPLQNFQYDTIMREYSRRQAQNHRILEKRTAEAYGKIPRLKEIDDEVATLSADKVRRLLNREEKGTADLKAAIQELSDERITLLVANGFPEIIWRCLIPVLPARTPAILAAKNAPVSRKPRSNCSMHSPI